MRPPGVREGESLARYTTIRTGGPAEFFARAGDRRVLGELLRWAAGEGLEVQVIGSGSNVLVADEGVAGLVLKLDGDLARIEAEPHGRLVCGGAARLPAVAALASRLGLGGIEFGVNIPGTVGGAVRMNANAYGGALARVLEWVEIVTAGGAERRGPQELGFSYRSSALRGGEIVARAGFLLHPRPAEEVRATLADMRGRRREAQPSGIRTFGSTFKNPPGERTAGLLLAQAGAQELAVGGARFSPKHANFVENTGTATTAEVIALMREGRRLVRERFAVELEPEVQLLGPVSWPG